MRWQTVISTERSDDKSHESEGDSSHSFGITFFLITKNGK